MESCAKSNLEPYDPLPGRKDLLTGVLLWTLFCVVAVLVRGVRWDETFEHAQVIAGQVNYPCGHPLVCYARGAFSLQTYVSAAMLWLGASPAWVCGFRNVLFLMASVMPVFLLTSLLARRTIWGHAAALLALQGIFLEFDGSYPLAVWPQLYSNGPIGGGCALLGLYFLLAGHWRAAFFLLGLMPCIHMGQMAPLVAVCGLFWLWALWSGRRTLVVRAFVFGVLGAAPCAAFLAVQRTFSVTPPMDGPYYCAADPHPIWAGYTMLLDFHRWFPPGNGHMVLAGMLLLAGAAAFWERRSSFSKQNRSSQGAPPERPLLGLFLYGLCIAATVWSIMIAQRIMGENVPFVLIVWMPYRLINHIPPILLALAVATLARSLGRDSPASVLIPAALLYCVLLPALPLILPSGVFTRYFAVGDSVFFGLYAGAATALLLSLRDAPREAGPGALPSDSLGGSQRAFAAWLGLFIAGLIGLSMYHQFGAACSVLGGAAVIALQLIGPRMPGLRRFALSRAVLVCLCLLMAFSLNNLQWRVRRHLPVTSFDCLLTAYLAEQGDPDAMLVTQPDAYCVQAKTGHPVFVDNATPSYISYMPALGPVIQKMHREVYGIRFDRACGETPPVPWRELWTARTRTEWQALAEEYGFRYVVAADSLELDLPLAFRDGSGALYEAPRS